MNYHGKGKYQWDTWYCKKKGTDEVHAFYLQCNRPGNDPEQPDTDSLGHAVSTNLLDWQELPPALDVEPFGQPGDLTSWTGSTIEHVGRYYLYYTIRSSANQAKHQQIGLAISDDLMNWQKYAGNPVITPDGRWYNTPENPASNNLSDCRDLMVVKHDRRPGYFGVFATRIPTEELPEGSVFAGAYTENMVDWDQTPPVYRSPVNRFSIVEMPDLFQLGGKWILTWLEDTSYSNRNVFKEPFLTCGTIYAVADNLEGPYIEPEDNILIASMGFNGFSCRTVDFKGKKYVLYSLGERVQENELRRTFGVLSTPKELKVIDGKICVCYADLIEEKFGRMLLDPNSLPEKASFQQTHETPGTWNCYAGSVAGRVRTAWCRYTFPVQGESFTYAAEVTVERGVAAGLLIRQGQDKAGGVALLDFEQQTIAFYTIPRFQIVDMRKIKLDYGKTYCMKVIANDHFIEVYLDDVLYLQFVWYFAKRGYFGLLLDRAEGAFKHIEAHELLIGDQDD